MGSKLGIHINDWDPADAIIAFIERARPRVVKVLSFDRGLLERTRAAIPKGVIVGRIYVSDKNQTYKSNPERSAKSFWDDELKPRVLEFGDLVDAWEGYNETGFGTDSIAKYARFEAERTRILADNGARSVVGNFATGTPATMDNWPAFFPALEAAKSHNGFLGLHEYSAPTMEWMYGPNQWNHAAHRPFEPGEEGLVDAGDTGWLNFRYRKAYREQFPAELKNMPLIITEGGIDGGINPRPGPVGGGWKDFIQYWRDIGRTADAEADYLSQLEWYDRGIQQDPFVVGMTIYCFGVSNERWESFNIVGGMAGRLEAYLLANPASPWPEEAPGEDPLVALLRARLGDAFDDIRDVLPQTGPYPPRPAGQIRYAAIHHTGAGTNPQTLSKAIAERQIADRGLPGIPFHFLVYPFKVRYSGDLLTARDDLPGHDAEAVNVALVGDFDEQAPGPQTLDLTGRLLDALDAHLGRPLTRRGHSTLAPSGDAPTCPGLTGAGEGGWLAGLNAVEPEPGGELEQLRAEVQLLRSQVQSLTGEVERLNAQVAELSRQADRRTAALQQIAGIAQDALG